MDVFGVSMEFGSTELYLMLNTLTETLSQKAAFLTDTQMAVLGRMVPRHLVATVCTPSTNKLFYAACTELPTEYRALVRMGTTADGEPVVAMCVAEVLVVALHGENHYSALVLDMVAREAYHFDSQPDCGHEELAESACATLHRLGVLVTPDVVESVSFHQPSTQCGLYVHLLASDLEEALCTHGIGDRSDTIKMTMRTSCSPTRAADLRFEYMRRTQHAFMLLYNAGSDLVESAEQAGALGPLCKRAALRALCKTYSPTSDQMMAALDWLVPTGLPVVTHRMPVGTDVIGEHAAQTVRASQFCLFTLVARGAVDCVESALLMVARGGDRRPVLFVPSGALPAETSATVNAILACFGADRVELNSGGWCSTRSSAALPFLLLSWWGMYGSGVATDELADELCNAAKQAQLPWRRCVDTGRDWMFRQLVAVALADGHARLVHAEDSMRRGDAESRGIRTQYDEDPLAVVHKALTKATVPLVAAVASARTRSECTANDMAALEDAVDELTQLASLKAPPRWNWSAGVDEVRKLYYYMVRKHLSSTKVVEQAEALIRAARRVIYDHDNSDGVQTTVTPVLDYLLATWPFLLVGEAMNTDHHVSFSPADPAYGDAVAALLNRRPDDPIQLVLCPVVLVHGQRAASLISMAKAVDMMTSNELDTWATTLPNDGDYLHVSLTGLGASRGRDNTDTFVAGEHSSLALTDTEMRCPVFTDFNRLPMVTLRSTSSSASLPSSSGPSAMSVISSASAQWAAVSNTRSAAPASYDPMDQ